MFQYDAKTPGAPAAASAMTPKPSLNFGEGLAIVRRNLGLIVLTGVAGAIAAYALTGLLPAKYVATAEIYVDPSPVQSATSEPIAPGQDSNGFVNYVESQKLIVMSRSVLERAARAEGLDQDPDFGGEGTPSLFSALFHPSSGGGGDPVTAAARALESHLRVSRPERTFVLDIEVTYKNPERAAAIANAVAKAYVEEIAHLREDSARQTSTAIAQHLESLRAEVIKAEKAIETYRAEHGLAGARDGSLIEQQLRALQEQIASQRAKESDAKARADGAEAARKNDAELGAFAAQFGLMTLSQLRSQQAEAKQKYADAQADLGPRHPQAMEAEARVKAADAAVDAELTRFARAQRLEYQRAKVAEVDLDRQVDAVKKQTNTDDEAMVGLRDLERKAQAARDVYELFVQRSRDTGVIQDVAPTRTKVISAASPPKTRAFPPSGAVLAMIGFVGGLGLGFVGALLREAQRPRPAPTIPVVEVNPTPAPAAPLVPVPTLAPAPILPLRRGGLQVHNIGARSRLTARARPQSLASLDLTGLGFATLAAGSDSAEFRDLLDTVVPRNGGRRIVAVTGANDQGERSTLAVNLALAAARTGQSVALLEAAGRNARLTRAVRLAARLPVLEGGPAYETANGVRLVLPKAGSGDHSRVKPLAALRDLIAANAYTLILCDGPDAGEVGAGEIFALCDGVIALENRDTAEQLEDLDVIPTAWANFVDETSGRKRA